jgi:hypothetical protein
MGWTDIEVSICVSDRPGETKAERATMGIVKAIASAAMVLFLGVIVAAVLTFIVGMLLQLVLCGILVVTKASGAPPKVIPHRRIWDWTFLAMLLYVLGRWIWRNLPTKSC